MPSLGSIYIRDISGHAALIDSSGNLQVNVAAGNLNLGAVTVSGNAVAISGQLISFASGATANLSGLNVITSVSTTTNISGQQVYLGSGSNFVTLSGASVSVSGSAVTTSISGNAIASGVFIASGLNVIAQSAVTSGEIHIISGIVGVASGIVSVMSGNVAVLSGAISLVSGEVHVVSGQVSVSGLFGGFSGAQTFLSGGAAVSGAIPVIPMMYDILGKQWTPFSTNISGSTVLSVWQASGLVSISSGAISVTSGAISVLSGEVHVMSGSVVLGAGTSMIGSVSVASGATSVISGEIHVISGGITVLSGGATIGTVTIGSQPISVTTSISGNAIASGIVPNISGQAVSVSGNTVITSISGNAVSISGNILNISGVTPNAATQIRIGLSGTAVQSGIPNTSGGTALQSGDLYVITVRNVSGNNDMYVGGSGARPFSGFGFVLCGGDAVTMSITNANLVYVFATTSGQFIKWIGSQF